MFGFVLGTACLIGLISVLRRGHWRGWHHYGGGYGGHGGWAGGWGRGGGWRGGGPGPGFGQRWMLRALFQRLDTTPGQEKVIEQSFEEARDAMRKGRDEMRATRSELGKAVRGEQFDAVQMGDLFGRHDVVIEEVRKAIVGALSRVHDVLDERQRGLLADFIENGPGAFRGGWQHEGPGEGYRGGWGGGCGWGGHRRGGPRDAWV